jgi:hypothetical protein
MGVIGRSFIASFSLRLLNPTFVDFCMLHMDAFISYGLFSSSLRTLHDPCVFEDDTSNLDQCRDDSLLTYHNILQDGLYYQRDHSSKILLE